MIERKQDGKEIFFDGVDALMTAPLMLLLGARIFKWKLSLSFFMEIEIEPDVFNTLSLVFIVMALVTGSLGFVSMFLEPQRNKV